MRMRRLLKRKENSVSKQRYWWIGLLMFFLAPGVTGADKPTVPFLAGGVGSEERESLLAARDGFNTHFIFAVSRSGHFVADVIVRIEDARGGEVLDTMVPGPLLYIQLAPGRYSVAATYNGMRQTRRFEVRVKRRSQVIFYWDAPASREDEELQFKVGEPPHSLHRAADVGR